MNLKKNLLALSVGAVIAAASTAANANSLLFPYFTANNGSQSSLSLSTDSSVVAGGVRTIHYVFNYGDACTHFDLNGKMTANDLLQQSVLAPAAGGYGLATASDGSTPAYFPLNSAAVGVKDLHGFMVVSDTTSSSTTAISGDMAIVDPSTGLVASYSGITNNLNTSVKTNEGNFSSLNQTKFGLSLYPQAAVTTSWFTVVTGDMSTAIAAGADWKGAATLTNNGNVYDNDENSYSGTVTTKITCSGTVTPTNLMNGAQQTAIGPNGGLINATWAPDAATSATGVVMYKMQLVSAAVGAPFGGKMFLTEQK